MDTTICYSFLSYISANRIKSTLLWLQLLHSYGTLCLTYSLLEALLLLQNSFLPKKMEIKGKHYDHILNVDRKKEMDLKFLWEGKRYFPRYRYSQRLASYQTLFYIVYSRAFCQSSKFSTTVWNNPPLVHIVLVQRQLCIRR